MSYQILRVLYQSSSRTTRSLTTIIFGLFAILFLRSIGVLGSSSASARLPEQIDPSSSLQEPLAHKKLPQVTWKIEYRSDPFKMQRSNPHSLETVHVDSTPKQSSHSSDQDHIKLEAMHNLKIRSVIFGEASRVMINGKPYAAGDTVMGYHIMKIDRNGIVVERDGVQVQIQH